MRTRPLLAPVLALLMAIGVVGGTAVPLASATAAATGSASAPVRRPHAVLTLHKNYRDTLRSRLTWQVFDGTGHSRRTVQTLSWRAGSGFTRHSTDSCRRNDGWLPNGRYRPRLYRDYGGSVIKGRAIYLGQKRCHDGTLRTALFIHTEQGAGSHQCHNLRGDQACRWEYPRIDDYRSLGCVKLSPGDLHELYDAWRRYFPLGSPGAVRVQVR